MSFPHITNLSDFSNHIDKPEISTKNHENGYTVISYMFQDSHTFDGPAAPWTRECRGITFAPDGTIASRPLHKFFNVGEKEETFEQNLDWDNIDDIMDKRDGSMISPVLSSNGLLWKTKKTFDNGESEVANTRYGKGTPEYQLALEWINKQYTPIFELTSPINRIVLQYTTYDLTLLAIRNNITGEYLSRDILLQTTAKYGVKLVDTFLDEYRKHGFSPFKEKLDHGTHFEGYVIRFKDGTMVKFKSKWYLELHRVVTFVRERDIASMVLNETVDDYKSYLNSINDFVTMEKVNTIETTVLHDLLSIRSEVNDILNQRVYETPKDVALQFSTHKLFSLIISQYRGKEPDYNAYYTNYILTNKFSLETV